MNDIVRLLGDRAACRAIRNWKESDRLRDELDALGVFVIDQADGEQKAIRLNEDFFRHMKKVEEMHGISFVSRRKYLEWRIQQDARAEKAFEAWLFSMRQSMAAKK